MKHLQTYKIFESKNNTPDIILNSIITIKVKYYGFDDQIHEGEIECNKNISDDLVEIFKKLLEMKFPIYQINTIDKYNYDDELSVRANNTSCFNFRVVMGTNKLSDHATGNAIDINPIENPWVHPSALKIPGREYDINAKGTINQEVVNLFKSYGWSWGGIWRNPDYQHFFKPDTELKNNYYKSIDQIPNSSIKESKSKIDYQIIDDMLLDFTDDTDITVNWDAKSIYNNGIRNGNKWCLVFERISDNSRYIDIMLCELIDICKRIDSYVKSEGGVNTYSLSTNGSEIVTKNISDLENIQDQLITILSIFPGYDYTDKNSIGIILPDNTRNSIYEDILILESKGLKFTKQPKKKGAKTDTFNVSKGGNTIGRVKWSSRMRGYAFLPTDDCDTEIKDFVKDLMRKRREEKRNELFNII